jgi:hypothetical protein
MIARLMSAVGVGVALLSGCGAANAAAMRPAPEADCSFRSVTTCWTLAGRFPDQQSSPPAPSPEELRAPPRAVLASTADSAAPRP